MVFEKFFAQFVSNARPGPELEPVLGPEPHGLAESYDDLVPNPALAEEAQPGEFDAKDLNDHRPGGTNRTEPIHPNQDLGSNLGARAERLSKKKSRRLIFFFFAVGLPFALIASLFAAGIWSWKSGRFDVVRFQIVAASQELSATVGLTISEVWIYGRGHTSKHDIAEAIGAHQGAAILSVDPHQVKARLETLPWVESAFVERILPAQLSVSITERQPVAIWQSDGIHKLIDRNGLEISGASIEPFVDRLPIVTGPEAPQHTAELIAILSREPELFAQTLAATRVGKRRWDVTLIGEVIVMLPDHDMAHAWSVLAEAQRRGRLLERAINRVDLRITDRIVVTPSEATATNGAGFSATGSNDSTASALTDA